MSSPKKDSPNSNITLSIFLPADCSYFSTLITLVISWHSHFRFPFMCYFPCIFISFLNPFFHNLNYTLPSVLISFVFCCLHANLLRKTLSPQISLSHLPCICTWSLQHCWKKLYSHIFGAIKANTSNFQWALHTVWQSFYISPPNSLSKSSYFKTSLFLRHRTPASTTLFLPWSLTFYFLPFSSSYSHPFISFLFPCGHNGRIGRNTLVPPPVFCIASSHYLLR